MMGLEGFRQVIENQTKHAATEQGHRGGRARQVFRVIKLEGGSLHIARAQTSPMCWRTSQRGWAVGELLGSTRALALFSVIDICRAKK